MTPHFPSHEDLCCAPQLAILAALEVSLVVSVDVMEIAHTEVLVPGAEPYHPGADTVIAALLIEQASDMIATINRYRLALIEPEAFGA